VRNHQTKGRSAGPPRTTGAWWYPWGARTPTRGQLPIPGLAATRAAPRCAPECPTAFSCAAAKQSRTVALRLKRLACCASFSCSFRARQLLGQRVAEGARPRRHRTWRRRESLPRTSTAGHQSRTKLVYQRGGMGAFLRRPQATKPARAPRTSTGGICDHSPRDTWSPSARTMMVPSPTAAQPVSLG
jgi:hypothetical protein